jgi:hypothetical protein
MGEKNEPELDFDLLRDWCAFCEGSRKFSSDHFSTILMGVFLDGLTPEVDRFLREFTKCFPPPLYKNLVRICSTTVPDRDVLPWIRRDLDEKRKLFDSSAESRKVLKVIDKRRFAFTHDHEVLQEVRVSSANHSVLYDTIGDFVIEKCDGDARLLALQEALYKGVATDYFVADSIMAPLLKTDIELGHYFEIYLRGGEYALDKDRIVVYTNQLPGEVSISSPR